MVQNQNLLKLLFFSFFKEELIVSRYVLNSKLDCCTLCIKLYHFSFFIISDIICNFIMLFSAILEMHFFHTSKPYKFLCKERFVYYAFMRSDGPMFYFCNGKKLPKHFFNLNENRDGQRVFTVTFLQVIDSSHILLTMNYFRYNL